jgi:hypothetical protein
VSELVATFGEALVRPISYADLTDIIGERHRSLRAVSSCRHSEVLPALRSEPLAPASKFERPLAEVEKFLVVDLLCFPSSVRVVMKFVAVVQQVS